MQYVILKFNTTVLTSTWKSWKKIEALDLLARQPTTYQV